MPRYIDADALIENIKRVYCTDCNNYNEVRCRACGTDDAMMMIDDAPSADVAPRAEVAREIFEELEQESFGYADEDGDWFCIYEKDYEEIQKKHLAATGTNDSGKDMI